MKELVDRIYEAAFVPELWPSVIERIGQISVARSGSLLIMDGVSEPRWKATEVVQEALGEFIESGAWRSCAMAASAPLLLRQGFVLDRQVLAPEVMATDPAHQMQRTLGLGSQLACVLQMPTEEFVVWTLEHDLHAGPPDAETVERLNNLIGHLARSSLVAARLGLEKARATVSALQSLGLLAAVLSASLHVTASNALLDEMTSLFVATAHGRIALRDAVANRLFQEALQSALSGEKFAPQSLPVKATDDTAPAVIHVVPLRRAARDVFSGADILIVATTVNNRRSRPSPSMLAGLFDLSPAESRLAACLSEGLTLAGAASRCGITISTARTYLHRIFQKTGARQQSQLVAMLADSPPLVGPFFE
jgi:DNA-binding CsgD family transcriptional regulator